jgi:large repetitive protein
VINDNGGTTADTAFILTATGPVTITGIEGAPAVTGAAVNAGTYALSESSLAGYTGGSWTCVGGTLTGSSLVLTQAQNAVCTVTNDDQPAALTLLKSVVNDNGGTNADGDFTLTAAGPTNITGIEGTAAVTNAAVNAGVYALSEATNSNYTASAWSCAGGALSGSNLTLALGQSANCTITNTFVPAPALTIDKTADTAGPLVVGQTVTYSYLVTNTGNVPINGVSVMETAFNGSGAPPIPVAGGPTTITPGQTVTFTATYVVTQQDVDSLQ